MTIQVSILNALFSSSLSFDIQRLLSPGRRTENVDQGAAAAGCNQLLDLMCHTPDIPVVSYPVHRMLTMNASLSRC